MPSVWHSFPIEKVHGWFVSETSSPAGVAATASTPCVGTTVRVLRYSAIASAMVG